MSALRERTNDTLKQRLREQVDQAWNLADAVWRQERLRRPPHQVQRLIAEALRPLRYFDGRGYFFIDGLDGRCVLLPTAPQLEGGSLLLANRDDQGRYIMRALIESVDNPQQRGFSSYRWYQPGRGEMSEKVAYARRFGPYNWLIGSGEYLNNVETDMQKQGLEMLARMRFGHDSGDFMIIDRHGVILLDPSNPTMNGKHYSALPGADRGRIAELIRRGKQGGFMEYLISSLDAPQGERYLSYARQLPGWDWTLVTSLRVQSIEDSSQRARQELELSLRERIVATLLLLTLAALLVAAAFCWFFLRWLNALVQCYRQDLQQSHLSLEQRSRDLRLSHFMVDNATDLIALRNAAGDIVYCNQAARQRLDCGCDAAMLTRALFRPATDALPHTFDTRLQCCGEEQWLEVTVSPLNYQGEDYLCATGRDITARRQTDRQLRLAAKVFESSNEAILVTDPDNRILAVNRAFCAITGYEESEALGQTPALLASGRHEPAFFENMWQQLTQRGQWSGEIWNRRKNGDIFPEWLNISVLQNEQGEISHYVALFTDISERKEQEARVQHLAEYDALTDLPNRVLINDRLQQAIRQSCVRASWRCCSSIWITSRTSTTPWATAWATSC
ncbi:cache domain-containing protein [Chromobacterium haemolyticum]|nr:cache domain-containing protein [Chromobacterium haemolyticum]